jgi:hypothetical protein
MSRILKWYQSLRTMAFKKQFLLAAGDQSKWRVINDSNLPDWALNPRSDDQKELVQQCWKSVSADFLYPTKNEMVDLTRGSEIRVCLEYVFNLLRVQDELHTQMDLAHPNLFATANGVLDTTCGKLLPFHPSQLCSRSSKVCYRGLATQDSRFSKFLLDCLTRIKKFLNGIRCILTIA